MTALVLRGDARRLPLPDASVDLVVTSPPYFALRSYTDGGQHYAGQLGSEATPAEYIGALIACTREWMRVLKPSGSIFVNLGDSYSGAGAGTQGSSGQRADRASSGAPAQAVKVRGRQRRGRPGRQFTREDAAWLAGVVDSDGSVSIHVNKQPEGRAPSFVAWVRIGQMRPEVVHRAAELTGIGQVYQDARGVWNWSASAQQARWVLARIAPWLLIKQRQAWAAIEVARHVEDRNGRGAYRPLTPDDIAYRQQLQAAVRDWNAGRDNDLRPPEPAAVPLPIYALPAGEKSLQLLPEQYRLACIGELGLYARAVLIWSKPNGLPESVTDRVRRSHEDWVHLTKQPRYFAAVDEIREQYSDRVQQRQKYAGRSLPARDYAPGTAAGDRAVGILGLGSDGNNPLGKLPGSVWEVATEPLRKVPGIDVDHYAAFPTEWPRRLILGWSSAGICTACGEGRRPVVDRTAMQWRPSPTASGRTAPDATRVTMTGTMLAPAETRITGYACGCPDVNAPTRPAVVLDPFGGTGTTAHVAAALGRTGITVDLSRDYCRLASAPELADVRLRKVLGIDKAEPVTQGQTDILTELADAERAA